LVSEAQENNLVRIPFLRISTDPIARTVVRHMLLDLILHGSRQNIRVTIVNDNCPDPALQEAIAEVGFFSQGDISARISLNLMANIDEVREELHSMSLAHPSLQEIIEQILEIASEASSNNDLLQYTELERLLWPLKLKGIPLPSYLIPIHPRWSMHLFDQELADQTLWGAKEKIALSVENVYYRSASTLRSIKAPGRILWYVTNASGYSGVKQIRACSILDEVYIASASDVFRRFSRLGVYSWDNVLRTANGDPNQEIMAIRFSFTELLPNPISLDQYRMVLTETEEKSPMLQSPSELDFKTFEALYELGTKRNIKVD